MEEGDEYEEIRRRFEKHLKKYGTLWRSIIQAEMAKRSDKAPPPPPPPMESFLTAIESKKVVSLTVKQKGQEMDHTNCVNSGCCDDEPGMEGRDVVINDDSVPFDDYDDDSASRNSDESFLVDLSKRNDEEVDIPSEMMNIATTPEQVEDDDEKEEEEEDDVDYDIVHSNDDYDDDDDGDDLSVDFDGNTEDFDVQGSPEDAVFAWEDNSPESRSRPVSDLGDEGAEEHNEDGYEVDGIDDEDVDNSVLGSENDDDDDDDEASSGGSTIVNFKILDEMSERQVGNSNSNKNINDDDLLNEEKPEPRNKKASVATAAAVPFPHEVVDIAASSDSSIDFIDLINADIRPPTRKATTKRSKVGTYNINTSDIMRNDKILDLTNNVVDITTTASNETKPASRNREPDASVSIRGNEKFIPNDSDGTSEFFYNCNETENELGSTDFDQSENENDSINNDDTDENKALNNNQSENESLNNEPTNNDDSSQEAEFYDGYTGTRAVVHSSKGYESTKASVRSVTLYSGTINRRHIVDTKPDFIIDDNENESSLEKEKENRYMSTNQNDRMKSKASNNSQRSFRKNLEALTISTFQEFNNKVFGGRLENVSVKWSTRLRTTAGLTRNTRKPAEDQDSDDQRLSTIELSTKCLTDETRLRSTLMHEMCHAAAWVVDGIVKPPHGDCFEKWANRAMKKVKDVDVTTTHDYEIQFKYAWACTTPGCGNIIRRHSRSLDVEKFGCGKCKGGRFVEIEGKGCPTYATPRKKAPLSDYNLFIKNHSQEVRQRLERRLVEQGLDPTVSQAQVLKECARLWRLRCETPLDES